MRNTLILVLTSLFVTGCYTQIKSSGDYWGYSGHRQPRAVLVASDTTYPQQQQPQAQVTNPEQEPQYSEDDSTLPPANMIVNNYYEVSPWGRPYYSTWGYVAPPVVSFSVGFGDPWGYYDYAPVYRPYWGWQQWYWDSWYYNPYYYSGWNSYWYGGWNGCLVPSYYPSYAFYRPYYRGHHYDHRWEDRNSTNVNNNTGQGRSGRSGRIIGGEQRSTTGSGGRSNSSSTSNPVAPTGRSQQSGGTVSPNSGGRSTQSNSGNSPRSVTAPSESRPTNSTAPAQGRSTKGTSEQPAKVNESTPVNSAPQGRSGSSSTQKETPRYYNSVPRGTRAPSNSPQTTRSAQNYGSSGNGVPSRSSRSSGSYSQPTHVSAPRENSTRANTPAAQQGSGHDQSSGSRGSNEGNHESGGRSRR